MTRRAVTLTAAALGYLLGWGTGWAVWHVRCGDGECCGPGGET